MCRSRKPGTASPPAPAGAAPTSRMRPSATTTSPGTSTPSTSAARTPSRMGPEETDGRPDMWSRPLYLPSASPAGAAVLLGDLEGLDADVVGGLVARVCRLALDRGDDLHAVDDLAEDGVLAVEPRRLARGDQEELRAVGVRAGVGHRQRAADDLVLVDLVLERVARTAGAGALRAAALDHEVADDPVEDQPVVEAVTGELLEVRDRLGGVVVEELDRDRPLAGGHRGGRHAPQRSEAIAAPAAARGSAL